MMMEFKEKVSIAVCTYNGEKFLVEQLESLVNQTYQNLQIVVVDDCSTDQTSKILTDYQHKYDFIEVHYNTDNLGYIKNFEKAIALCKGKYITLCDQDDIWHHDKIEILLAEFNDQDILIYHDSTLINEEGSLLGRNLSKTIGYISGRANRNLLLNNCIAGHAIMFRQNFITEIIPFPVTIPHDHWLAYIALTIGNVKYLKQALVNYRQHTTTVTYTLHLKEAGGIKDKYVEKMRKREEIKMNRLKHLENLISFSKNSPDEVAFTTSLMRLLKKRDDGLFSFSLFWFLCKNQHDIYELYHKSFLGNVNMAYKESLSNKAKLFFYRLMS